jgi:Tol biopolymer transport system component
MNADGSDQRRITGGATRGFVQFVHAAGIAWSSTGRIAYAVWDDKAQTEDVVVANADGTDPHLLGLDPNVPGLQHRTPWFESLAWTPDGSRLLFGLDNVEDQWGIFSVAADGSGLEHLRGTIEGDALPRASPDGGRLVYTRPSNGRRGSDLRIADANGMHARWLTHARGEDVGGSWSPDGRRVVFASQRGAKPSRQVSSPFDLFVVDVSTRHVHRLLHLRGNELDPQWQPG